MRIKALTFVFILVFCACHQSHGQAYWIRNVHIIDVENGNILYNQNLRIGKGKIAAIAPGAGKIRGRVIEGKGNYVIPGLWDMHVHLDMVGAASLPLFLHYGITGVRDMGGEMEALKQLKKIAHAPDILTPGPILESPQFYQILRLLLGAGISHSRVPYRDPQAIGFVIDSLHAAGSDFIKIRTVSSEAALEALGKACQEKGVKFAGHVDNVDLLTAVRAGIASIEHIEHFPLLKMTTAGQDSLARSVGSQKPFFTPTLIATRNYRLTPPTEVYAFVNDSSGHTYPNRRYISSKLLEFWLLQLQITQLEGPSDWQELAATFTDFGRKLVSNGGVLLAGTDAGAVLVMPGEGLHSELELMVQHLKISNLTALQAATLNPAKYLNRTNIGIIKEGALANLVLLEANPLESISNTQSIRAVIKEGKLYDRQTREKMLAVIARQVELERKEYNNTQLNYFNKQLKALMGGQMPPLD